MTHRFALERNQILDVQLIRLFAAGGQQLAGLADDAERRAPTDERRFGIFRAFEFRRLQLLQHRVHLLHPFFHHFAADGGIGKYVADQHALLVVVVGSGHVHRIRRSRQGARRDPGGGKAVTLERSVALRPILDNLSPFDGNIRTESIRLHRLGMFAEQQIGNDHDRKLVLISQVQSFDRRVVTIGDVRRGDDHTRIVPLGCAEDLIQVALLLLGRKTGGRPSSLYFDKDDRSFNHTGHSDRFGHQSEAAARGGAHRPHPRVTGPDGDVGHGQLVFALLDDHAGVVGVSRHPMKDGGSRGHRIGGIEAAAARHGAERHGLVPGDERPADVGKLPALFQRHEFGFGKLESGAKNADVLINHFLALVGEGLGNHGSRHVEIEPQHEDQRAHGHRVLHDGQNPSEGFYDFGHRQRRRDHSVLQFDAVAVQLARIVENRPALFHLRSVPFDGVLIEGDQGVESVPMRIDLVGSNAEPQPDVPAANQRLVTVVSIDVETSAGGRPGQRISGLIQSVAGGASDSYREFLHRILLETFPWDPKNRQPAAAGSF